MPGPCGAAPCPRSPLGVAAPPRAAGGSGAGRGPSGAEDLQPPARPQQGCPHRSTKQPRGPEAARREGTHSFHVRRDRKVRGAGTNPEGNQPGDGAPSLNNARRSWQGAGHRCSGWAVPGGLSQVACPGGLSPAGLSPAGCDPAPPRRTWAPFAAPGCAPSVGAARALSAAEGQERPGQPRQARAAPTGTQRSGLAAGTARTSRRALAFTAPRSHGLAFPLSQHGKSELTSNTVERRGDPMAMCEATSV